MRRALVIGVLLLATLGVVQADSGGTAQTVVAGDMHDGPYSDANPVGSVPVNTNVTILTRQGGWYKVRLPTGQTGWLPMTDLRLGNPGSGGSNQPKSSGSHGFFSLFESGRSGASGTTATTGVRGLNTGDIANAKPDPAAVTELDQWMAKPDAARAFAEQLKLKAEKIDYLPKVKP
ncbi:MAG TPA: SH3 domain-containing protein [Gammaproteobacteria bacterium]|nr:SH3 domain-containing protein [Gammaproteobacteria bacterium]